MSGPIEDLVRELEAEFGRDPRGPRVARALSRYALERDDWRGYAHFDPQVYTRNLVARREAFELLVLAWNAGQTSPIHNHSGQQCWMAVLEGDIEEVQFEWPRGDVVEPLRATRTTHLSAGKVAYIDDDIALHLVRPGGGARGVSLHLYSRPIETCDVYDPTTGRVAPRTMAYYSIDGRRIAAPAV